jgi:hypothetical protein
MKASDMKKVESGRSIKELELCAPGTKSASSGGCMNDQKIP